MKALRSLVHGVGNARGFSLVEVLVASAMLIIGVAVAISALMYGVSGVESGRGASTAVFLAEQRLEQVRAFVVSTDASRGFGNLASASFPAEAYGSITAYPNYRRTVTITANAGGNADLQLVTVTVFYRPTTHAGVAAETSTALQTLVSRR